MTKKQKPTLLLLTFTIIISVLSLSSLQNIKSASNLTLTLFAQEAYDITNPITINGSLTQDGTPVTDALVSMQINNPRGNIHIMRVFTTGSTPPGPWPVEIVDFYLCDANGNPKTNFKPGGALGYTITVKNNGASPQYVIVILTFAYSNGLPFSVITAFNETLEPSAIRTSFRYIYDFIPSNAPLGPAYAYAVAINNLTQYGGMAWCPERSTTFNITLSSGSLTLNGYQTALLDSTPGTFSITIKISDNGGRLGNYTIYANTWYNLSYAQDTKIFKAFLRSDVNLDGTVDMADISILIEKFMLTDDDPDWDPIYDLVEDGSIDMADISKAIDDYFLWGYY
ncbi:MAG: hypothetical protein QXJ11_06265 [Candidatus Bathyarchaeia archaeon]